MISIEKGFLFIHVPKTGGNSIQNVLRHFSEDEIVAPAGHQDGIERFEVRSRRYDVTKHSTLRHYRDQIGEPTFGGLFKFATIRNPWDMAISYYFSPHRDRGEWDRGEFVRLVDRIPTLRHFVFIDKMRYKVIRKIANSDFCRIDKDIDFLMKFETLDEDFRRVCRRLGIPFTGLGVHNKSRRKHYSHYYDDELIDLVRRKFHEEIKIGSYEFISI